jgi:hypothetical protein
MFGVTVGMGACVPQWIANCQLRIADFLDPTLSGVRSAIGNWQLEIGNALRRHERLQLQGMEGKFLSGEDSG